ncbi:MAG: cyclic nucleotide-binding domain-containing protein, partial [Gammaproteobacteria bacterium]
RYLDTGGVRALEGVLDRREVAAGERLFNVGDEGAELFLVCHGQIEIRVPTTAHHHKRLAVYGPGSFFGELALLKAGPRAADAVATTASTLWTLSREHFDALKRARPEVAIDVLAALCDNLVVNQRWSTRELKRLSEW